MIPKVWRSCTTHHPARGWLPDQDVLSHPKYFLQPSLQTRKNPQHTQCHKRCTLPAAGIRLEGSINPKPRVREMLARSGSPQRPPHYPGDRPGRCVGRFLPFAIYSQTDSPQECQSNEKYHETKLFSCQRDHQGLHIRHEYPHFLPPAARQVPCRSELMRERFSRAARRAR